jgi:hypothetical protein
MPEPRSARLAVLIDADNASPRIADGLFEEVAKIGEASVHCIWRGAGGVSSPLSGIPTITSSKAEQPAHCQSERRIDVQSMTFWFAPPPSTWHLAR